MHLPQQGLALGTPDKSYLDASHERDELHRSARSVRTLDIGHGKEGRHGGRLAAL